MLCDSFLYLTYSITPVIYCTCKFLKYFVRGAKDLSIFSTNISLLNKFLKHFASCFSKKQLAMFTLLVYALFKDYKRNSLDAMAKAHSYRLSEITVFLLRFQVGLTSHQTKAVRNHSKPKNHGLHKRWGSCYR